MDDVRKTIENARGLGRVRFVKYRAGSVQAGKPEILEVSPWHKNLILASTATGFGLIVRRMAANTTYDVIVTSGEIGTSNSASTEGMTALVTPVTTGILVASSSYTAKQALLTFFIPDAQLPNGTYWEFLMRMGAQAFSRAVAASSYVKASGEDTGVEYEVNFDNA